MQPVFLGGRRLRKNRKKKSDEVSYYHTHLQSVVRHCNGIWRYMSVSRSGCSCNCCVCRQIVNVSNGRLGSVEHLAVIWRQRNVLLKTEREIGLSGNKYLKNKGEET